MSPVKNASKGSANVEMRLVVTKIHLEVFVTQKTANVDVHAKRLNVPMVPFVRTVFVQVGAYYFNVS